jgi:hypothetical protein
LETESPFTFVARAARKQHEDKGKILEFIPHQRIAYLYWSNLSGLPDCPENYHAVMFEPRSRARRGALRKQLRNGISWFEEPRRAGIKTKMNAEDLLRRAYDAFDARDIDTVLTVMHPAVVWPNAMEGGCVLGHAGIREYWTRQWSIVDPHVEPLRITTESDGRVVVDVHQRVRDLAGNVFKGAFVQHIYQLENGLIKSMEIREPPEPPL